MSANKVLPHSELYRTLSLGSKVFILGEYAVLAGLPAVVAALEPRFKLHLRAGHTADFAAESPIGRLLSWAKARGLPPLEFQFEDPFEGTGGFGASTAQFALAYRAYGLGTGWQEVWTLYRELTGTSGGIPPSGADLVAQWQGGVVCFDPVALTVKNFGSMKSFSQLLVFSATSQASRKTATHQHLAVLGKAELNLLAEKLKGPLERGILAIEKQDSIQLGMALDDYATALQIAQLEIPATFEDRQVLRNMPGVLGVKGTGALQADGLVVLMDSSQSQEARQSVVQVAVSRGLKLISDGLRGQVNGQKGVTCSA